MKLELAPRAVQEAERHALWWAKNREKSPGQFAEELRVVLRQIADAPHLGAKYSGVAGRVYQRVLMSKTRCHVYYRVVAEDHVRIVAIWSAIRGRGPRLS